jgi:hypothetical protein
MITCQECEAEYEIVHDSVSEPEYCPFCSAKLRYEEDEEEVGEDDWYPDP